MTLREDLLHVISHMATNIELHVRIFFVPYRQKQITIPSVFNTVVVVYCFIVVLISNAGPRGGAEGVDLQSLAC